MGGWRWRKGRSRRVHPCRVRDGRRCRARAARPSAKRNTRTGRARAGTARLALREGAGEDAREEGRGPPRAERGGAECERCLGRGGAGVRAARGRVRCDAGRAARHRARPHAKRPNRNERMCTVLYYKKKRAEVALIIVCRTLPPARPRRTRCRSRPRQRRARRAVVTPAHPARACTGCRRHRSPARVPPRGCADGPRTAQRAAGQQRATALHVHAQARASTRADAQCPRPRVNAPVVRSANLQFLHLCVLGLGKANPHARAPPCRVSLLGQRHGAMRHMVEPHVGQERHAPLALLWRALLTNEQVAGGAVQEAAVEGQVAKLLRVAQRGAADRALDCTPRGLG